MPPSRHDRARLTREFIEYGIISVPPSTRRGSEFGCTAKDNGDTCVYATSLWPVILRHRGFDTGSIDYSASYVPRICFDSAGMVGQLDYLTLLSPGNSSILPCNHPSDRGLLQSVTDGLNSQKKGSLADQYGLEKEVMDPEGILKLMGIVLDDCIAANLDARATDVTIQDLDQDEGDDEGEWSFGGPGTLSLNSTWYKLQTEDPRDTLWRIPSGTNDIERYLSFPHTAISAFLLMTDDVLDLRSTRKSKAATSCATLMEDSKIYKYRHITVDDQVVEEEMRNEGSEAGQGEALGFHQLTVLIPRSGSTMEDAVRSTTGAFA